MSSKLNTNIARVFRSRFKSYCHKGVIEGYNAMLVNPLKYKQWKEEKISARLLYEMKKLDFLKSKNIIVGRESHLEDFDILFGDKEASEADRIDFIFSSTWHRKENLEYFGEAKNLSSKNWKKESGPTVKTWDQKDYYIQTGIKGLVSGKYSKLEGFLIGYIVNGTASNNVSGLNKLIKKKALLPTIGLIQNQKSIVDYPNCYSSKNIRNKKEIVLQHIFLEFDN